MDPDTVSLVDILLPHGSSTERTLGKFRPKPRPKTVKPSPTPSRSLDGTQLIPPTLEPPSHAPDLKCPEEKLNLPSSLIDGSFTNASDLDVIQESVNQPVASHAERLISDNGNVVSLQCDQRESGEADMFSSMESLDFLKPPSTSVRAVGIFQPKAKAQSKGKILLRTSTGVPDGEKSVGASNNSSSSSASEAISSELHLTQETCLTEETVVLVGVSADKSQVSDSDASLQIDPDKSEHEAMTVVSCLESLGDGIFLSNSTAEQAPGKFHPKLRPKTVKQISACSISADASHLISPFLEPLLHASDVKCPEKGQGLPTICTTGTSTTCTSELHVSLESANQMEASHSEDLVFNGDKKETSKLDKENLKGLQMPDMFSSMESLQVDNHPALTTSSLTTGVGESLDASDISASSFPPVAISSKLHINQEPLSIIEEQVTSVEASQDRHEVSESFVNLHPHSDKPGAEATEMFSGIESSGDVFFQPSTSAVEPVGKFQPKLIPQPKRAKAKKISFILPDAAESVAPPVDSNTSSSQNEGTEMLACNSTGVEPSFLHMLGEGSLDDTPHSSFTFSDCNGDIQMGHEKSEEEDTTELTGIESLENILSQPMSTTGESQGKFQPKLSARVRIVKPTIPVTIHGVLEPLNSHDDSSPTDNSIFDVASPGSINILLERDNSVVGKAKSSSVSKDISKEVQSQDVELTQQILVDRSTSKTVEDDGACKSSRKLRKRISLCSPSGDDKTNDDWDFDDNISQNDEVQNDEEYSGEEVPKQKRAPRKSKRQMTENEKPVRKRNKASEIAVRKPVKKKFPHGTQRKRRQVNKELLEAFEDEHDRKQLSLKVLIMIGEDKERVVSKEAAALKKTSSNQSSSLPNGTHFDTDNPLGDEHHQNSDGDEANRNIELSSRKLNYHSFMEGRSARWSKSDTEKFYQAIRQFGTDFSLIQKLFPQRTRQQIKLKFKNEERKHRSQVNDALVHRTKDHSHFELMILKLQEEAEQNAYKEATDDPVTASQDGENENEEERGGPDKAEETNDWEGGVQSPGKFDEDGGGYQWDANASSPRDMEKDSYSYL